MWEYFAQKAEQVKTLVVLTCRILVLGREFDLIRFFSGRAGDARTAHTRIRPVIVHGLASDRMDQ